MIYDEDGVRLYHGDAVEVLASLPPESVDCVVTSPPYWGLRAYSGEQATVWGGDPDCAHRFTVERARGISGGLTEKQITNLGSFVEPSASGACRCGAWQGGYGAEPTPELYVEHTVEVLRAIRRVLKPSGVVWWNVGDSFASGASGQSGNKAHGSTLKGGRPGGVLRREARIVPGMKPKDLVLIPFRVALAAQADGWWVRSDVIWAKPNPMPESVTDRPTKAHEYVFLLTKSATYFWDQDAVREPLIKGAAGSTFTDGKTGMNGLGRVSVAEREDNACGRNIRSVWTIPTQPSPLPHFAAFPDELAERCIKAACPEKVCPACGVSWVRIVEKGTPILNAWSANGAAQYDDALGAMRPTSIAEGSTLKHIVPRETIGWHPNCHCPEDDDIEDVRPIGGVVLDPFAGTGTTLKVARQLGRKAIGIEISHEYVELAVQRLRYGTRGTLAVRQGQGTLWEGA